MATRLTEEQFARVRTITLKYVREHASITNRELRHAAGISYDQAIHFFNDMVADGSLTKLGKSSGTHYVLQRSE